MDMHSAQLQFNHHKQLLSLLKERAKDHPDIDQTIQKAILATNNKQDYLDIVNRITLSKNNTSNLIMELITHSRQTGKYGITVNYLDDLNKTWEQRMRIYLVDLNKSLKEVSENCVSIWKCFKKIKERLSTFGSKKEEESTNIIELMKKIRSFKEELEGQVYTISKAGFSQNKLESVPSSQKKIQSIQAIQTAKDLQQLRSKVVALHDSCFKVSVARENSFDSQEIQKMINSLQEKILTREHSPSKQVVVGQHSQTKDKVLSLMSKFFSTRSLPQMKLLQKQFEAHVGKISEFTQLKQALKCFVRDKQEEEQVPSPTFQKMTPTQQAQRVEELLKENKELRSKNLHLQQEVNKQKFQPSHGSKQILEKQAEITAFKAELKRKVDNEIKLESQIKKLLGQVEELKRQLDDRLKFSYLDNSRASTLSHQPELIHYQDTRNFSPEKFSPETRALKQNASPSIQKKAEGVIMEVVESYSLLEQKLRQEVQQLSNDKAELARQNSQLKSQNANTSNNSIQNYKIQEELSEYKTYLQQFWMQKKIYEERISQQAAKIHELQQNISHFFIEQRIYKSQLQKSSQEFESSRALYLLKEEQFKAKIRQLEQKLSALSSSQKEQASMLQAFFIEQKLYQGEIQKLKMERQEYKSMIDHFFAEISLYKNQIKKYRDQLEEAHAQLKEYSRKSENLIIHQRKIEALLANEEVLKEDIRRLKQSVQKMNGADLSSDIRRMAEQFWIEQKKYQHRISQLTQKNHELEQTISSFFIEQSIYQTQLQKYKNAIKDLQAEIKGIKELVDHEAKQKEKRLFGQLQSLKEAVRQKDDIISKLEISMTKQVGSPTMAREIIQKAKQLKKQNNILEKIQKSKGSMIEQLETQIQTLKLSVAYYRQISLFQADILEDNESQKSILINLVTTQMGRNIVKTKLIYKYDPLNKVSFHSYIDGHESILVLVKTVNTTIGGYYSGALCEQLAKDKDGFLFSLDEKECYPCVVRDKAVTYDKYFFIMGNSQLRLNISKQETFSNFAVNNAYYDRRGKRVTDFLKAGEARQTNFVNFEVYQVFFQEVIPVENVPQTNAQEQEDADILK